MTFESTEGTQREPLAVVGIGFRARDAAGPARLWELLRQGRDLVGTAPAERWQDVYDPNPLAVGKSVTRWGSFLEHVDGFDRRFFGVSPKLAASMDPQHRLLLEVAWEALEDAGMPAEAIRGSHAGVFVGMMFNDYGRLYGRDLRVLDGYMATANTFAHGANRISFFFDLRGPSLAIDTNCSGSLVAVHQACESVWRGESEWALAGGVSLILAPDVDISMSKASALSPTGRCRTWDIKADGFVRGEGAGLVVVKPLTSALADGDRIYCVIRGTAANHVGRGSWIMEPSSTAQRDVIVEACARAGVNGMDLDYVELHGTGTLKGDPIEAEGLGAAVSHGRSPEEPCRVGCIKTNFGHLDAAAGVAGLIKTALCIAHRELVPSLHFATPNPEIDLERLKLRVQTQAEPWPARNAAPLAGVTAVGFGGTNAHVILGGVARRSETRRGDGDRWHLLALSGRCDASRRALAEGYARCLEQLPSTPHALDDLCYTAAVRRTHHDFRLAVAGDSPGALARKLRGFLSGDAREVSLGEPSSKHRRKVVFVFPGHGPQWVGMARDLFELPAFRETIVRCDQMVRMEAGWSVVDELFASPERARLERSDVVQPVLFSMSVSLAHVWQSWGVKPSAVVGHSFGELAAACVAGAISLKDAIRIVCARGRVTREREGVGGVAVVELPTHEVLPLLERYPGLEIGGTNSPRSTIVTGSTADLEAFLSHMAGREVFARRVKLAYPSHSRVMDGVLDDFARAIGTVKAKASRIPIGSTVRGAMASGDAFDAGYWLENLRRPVRFAEAIQSMDADHDIFLEVSPHPVLTTAVEQSSRAGSATVVASLRRGSDGLEALNSALARMYAAGYDPAWAKRYPTGNVVTTPTYPWQRERAWLPLSSRTEEADADPSHSPLLGHHVEAADQTMRIWEARVGGKRTAFAREHRLQGVPVLPASAFVEMIVSAVSSVLGTDALLLSDLELRQALFLPETESYRLQLLMTRDPGDREYHARICGRREGSRQPWQVHATARVAASETSSSEPRSAGGDVTGAPWTRLSADECYVALRSVGLDYGPSFQGIEWLERRGDEARATVRLREELEAGAYYFHPAFHDACLHVAALTESVQARSGILPVRIARIALCSRPTTTVVAHARVVEVGERVRADVLLTSPRGEVIQKVEGIEFANLEASAEADADAGQWLYELDWTELPLPQGHGLPQGVARGSTWLVLADQTGVGAAVAEQIRGAGGDPIVVHQAAAYRRTSETTFEVRAGQAPDIRDVIECVRARPGGLAGVVHMWSLDLPGVEEVKIADLDAAILSTCGSAVNVLQALEQTHPDETTPMWLVTRGGQPHGLVAADMAPLQALLWGLGRALAYELPSRWGGLVDVDPHETAQQSAARWIASLPIASGGDDEIVWRSGRPHGARLDRARPLGERPQAELEADATYLVTGGTGGIGLVVAHWLAAHGAKEIMLAARTPLPPRQEWSTLDPQHPLAAKVRAVQHMEALGTRVDAVAIDVADPDALRHPIEERRRAGLPPIRGVFHLAGTVEIADLLHLDPTSLLDPMRSKVHATVALHRLLGEVDRFVLFSSASAVIRSPRLGPYAAANAFLDGMAHYRRSCGKPALAINWGLWSDVGYAQRLGKARGPSSIRGMKGIAPGVGVEILARLVDGADVQTVVWPSSWDEWARLYPAFARSHMVAHLRHSVSAATGNGNVPLSVPPLPSPVPDRNPSVLHGYIRELVASQLNLEFDAVPEDRPLEELGMDSLLATELRNRIKEDLHVKIPVVRLLGAATIGTITGAVFESLAGASIPPVTEGSEGAGLRQASGVEVKSRDGASTPWSKVSKGAG